MSRDDHFRKYRVTFYHVAIKQQMALLLTYSLYVMAVLTVKLSCKAD